MAFWEFMFFRHLRLTRIAISNNIGCPIAIAESVMNAAINSIRSGVDIIVASVDKYSAVVVVIKKFPER